MVKEISDPNHAILNAYLEAIRPPIEIRSKLDIGYTYDGTVVELYQIRPDWRDPAVILHHPYAKIKFTKSKNVWNLYWMRASGKWNEYKEFKPSTSLQKALDCIDKDEYGCFKG